ncbi:MAG TPA: hypothetical protein HA254_00215 [Candidatus Diapherotrites archaeon]|uniref:Uncharacterized protein n=1 Tax=Candidatus Iainarchaeum sp. TaxID=3101447 RepID=A0A7J4IWA9_9ARCH|nr:hypothetical protein [Candidatus Diapherotrites archaeon]
MPRPNQINDLKAGLNELIAKFTPQNAESGSKQAERTRHLLGELEKFNSQLSSLENTVSVGVPLAEATDAIERLNAVQSSLDSMETQINNYLVTLRELKEKNDELAAIFATKASKSQLESLANKVDSLGALYSQQGVAETKKTLKSLTDLMERLGERVDLLEKKSRSDAIYPQTEQAAARPAAGGGQKGVFSSFAGAIKNLFGMH